MSEPAPPYRDLYIYHLQGRVQDGAFSGSRAFIGNWQEGESAFLFFAEPDAEAVEGLLRHYPELTLCDNYQMDYAEWQGGVLKPFRAGRFSVIPAWAANQNPPEAEEIRLRLDPGVVFGAGTHPTTRDCLILVDRLFETETVSSALDIGTGTGILAAGAAKAGCRRVLAVDLNLLAAKTAMRNFALNRIEERALSVCGDAISFIENRSELLIANIHYDVMIGLMDAPGFIRKRWFILSGLLRSQAREIRYRLADLGLVIRDERVDDDGIWHTFFAGKRG